jgi:two-component system KDP operon response regulator KdpE
MSDPASTAILLEDESQIRRFVRAALEAENWRVLEADTLRQGLIHVERGRADLVVLDLGLPDGSGMDFLRALRGWSSLPVIVLSARSAERDKIAALDAGADDYLTKPFSVGELMARVRVAVRRQGGATAGAMNRPVRFGAVEVDLAARRVLRRGERVHLTPTEYRLLGALVGHAGSVLTHRSLLCQVWGLTHADQTHYLRIYMSQLRRKLEDDPARPRHLLTEAAVGYRLLLG